MNLERKLHHQVLQKDLLKDLDQAHRILSLLPKTTMIRLKYLF